MYACMHSCWLSNYSVQNSCDVKRFRRVHPRFLTNIKMILYFSCFKLIVYCIYISEVAAVYIRKEFYIKRRIK